MRRTILLLCLAVLLPGCGIFEGILEPVKSPTPGGLTLVYDDLHNERYRLPAHKVRELDERHAALLECLPREAFCRRDTPQVEIVGHCDSYVNPYGVRIRGGEYFWGRAVVPGSLGAAAHEMTHHYTCEVDGNSPDKPYKEKWLRKCGDEIDVHFRKMYPPVVCESDRKPKPKPKPKKL